jgi:hypothetical protein
MAGATQAGSTMNTIATMLNPRVTGQLMRNQEYAQQMDQEQQQKSAQQELGRMNPLLAPLSRMDTSRQSPAMPPFQTLGGANIPGRAARPLMTQQNQQGIGGMVDRHTALKGAAFPEELLAKLKESVSPTPGEPTSYAPGHIFGTTKNGVFTQQGQVPDKPDKPDVQVSPMTDAQRAAYGISGNPHILGAIDSNGKPTFTQITREEEEDPNKRIDYWRDYFKKQEQSTLDTHNAVQNVERNLKLGSGTGQIAAMNSLQKMIDEGAVVREADINLMTSAQSLINNWLSAGKKIGTGKIFNEVMEKELLAVAKALEEAKYGTFKDYVDSYAQTMTDEGVDRSRVFSPALRDLFTSVPGEPPPSDDEEDKFPVGVDVPVSGGVVKRRN